MNQRIDPTLVLASASPRRQELLRNAAIPFTVYPANVPEIRLPGEAPRAFAERLAREKASEVRERLRSKEQCPAAVLGADTIVVVGDEVLGKPGEVNDALRMLRLLSGRTHEVLTAVCLLGLRPGGNGVQHDSFQDVRSETTRVTFDKLTEQEIRDYVATGEPMDKAGAYAIQGMASRWVTRLEGDYSNVVGLPVRLVYCMLRDAGMNL
ncbi:MAG: nucleoside triphosphate pyrophosphatase [Candidatus Korobacteraceae bacterium]